MIRYPVQIYAAQKLGTLICTKVSVQGRNNKIAVLRLLIDTGSGYTILPTKPLEPLGYNATKAIQTRTLITASGIVSAPQIQVQSFNCFGLERPNFPVILYDLPSASRIDGIIGMDFLSQNRIFIATGEAEIYIPIASPQN
jgi:predicted aspartyl protease